jgi:ABC-type glutathione transport system ATPase component
MSESTEAAMPSTPSVRPVPSPTRPDRPDRQDYSHLAAVNVGKVFGRRKSERHPAVEDVSLVIQSGEAVGIVGESGSGKSTLARMLVGIETPTTGEVLFNGTAVSSHLSERTDRMNFRRAVQFVSQDTSSSFNPLQTLRDSVRSPAMRLLGLSRSAADQEVDRMVAELELSTRLVDRYPDQVSGGQRQRFALARALIVNPGLLICDEVVSALDVSVQGAVLNILRRYCRNSGAGLAFVSHGLPATAFVSDRMIVMYHGRVVEDASTDDVLNDPQHDYTKTLLAAYRGRPTARTETLTAVAS